VNLRERIARAASQPVDIASLAAFRIIFGAVMVVAMVRLLSSGQISQIYGEPRFFFTYPGFHWVTPWPVWGMYIHYTVLALLGLAIMLGAWQRVAAALFAAGFAYAQLIDVTNYLNHHYLCVLISGLFVALPANGAWSIDAWRRPALRRDLVPAWILWLARFQIGVVYVFAGLAKAKLDWLGAAQPLNIWLAARTETPIIGPLLDEPRVALAMAWGGFLFDTTIVAWLSWSRTRVPAYLVLIGFHGLTGYLFNIGMFPLIMTSAALIFFSPSWPRRLFKLRPTVEASDDRVKPPGRRARIAIAVYVIVQLMLPLRHFVYPGDVLWNEDGMRFAWHVMIREKHGAVTFIAELDGTRVEVPPSAYLTWRQEREMAGQPDLILQLARRIGADLRARGYRQVRVFAETAVSLNGRAPRALIDPAVDLLSIQDLGPREWVTTAPTSKAPQIQPLR
jgi:vitamin K-dependent gamma-carboxylase